MKYHCNYCGKKLIETDILETNEFVLNHDFICHNPECSAFALVQIPVELLPVKRKK